jgi:hypothetical protein
MPPHGIVTDAPTPPLSGARLRICSKSNVGGTHWLRVEEEDWGGGVNRDLSSLRLVLTTHTDQGRDDRWDPVVRHPARSGVDALGDGSAD